MDRLTDIVEWHKAAGTRGGYTSRRRLPADNPIFQPLRTLLRERVEWHGTPVQLQKELGDTRYCTAFGRLLQQAIPFLASEFLWEKHTMPKWGVVQFFFPKDRVKCRTKGCQEKAIARGRCHRCFAYLHRAAPGWKDDADLTWMRPCCFKDCQNELDDEFIDDAEFPVCTYHKRAARWRAMLEEGEGEEAVECFPWDEEWLAARFIHEVLRRASPENRHLRNNVCGDTPLFKLFMHFFARYEPFLQT